MLAMLLLSRIIVAEILSLLVVAHCVDSNVVNGEDDNSQICCVHENCSNSSLDQCLANLTSNVMITITTDVTLYSLVKASNLSNISIIGHDYPTVNYKSTGGIHFQFCHNCSIEGITWDGCGSSVVPGLKFSYSSNVTIQNCTFQHSLGKAVVLLGVLGDVNICDCKFTNNNDYMSHGAAIEFSSNDTRNSFQYVLTISRCNFSDNTMNSLIYFENARLNLVEAILINSTFYRNRGISLYLMNSHIYLIGRILFQNNLAEDGAGIYTKDYSNVTFDKNSKVDFINNSAHDRGGAIILINHSICLFDHNSKVTFNNNYATSGIIYSRTSSKVTFRATSEITFSSNLVRLHGAAIYSADNSHVTFKENTKVILTNNRVISAGSDRYYRGGILYSYRYSSIHFEGNCTAVFSNNAADYGGGIHIESHSNIFFQENSTTVFSNNIAEYGGGIYDYNSGNIFFQENSNTVFSNNTADDGGGVFIGLHSSIFFQGNSNTCTVFSNNTANHGGGIFIYSSGNIFFQKNSYTVFSNNTADDGGGIYNVYSNIYFQENSNTLFSNNTAKYGGGIYIELDTNICFQENSNTVFKNNIAKYSGGGIYTYNLNNISFQGNSNSVFSNNTADYGGGIYIINSSNILFQEKSITVFSNNTARYTGTIDAQNNCTIIFDDDATVTFNVKFGATIFSESCSKIIAQGNFSVTFNDHSAKWCNNTCLPYNGRFDSTVIDDDGIVWCNNQRGIYCSRDQCNCTNLEDILYAADINASTPLHVNINISYDVVLLSSLVLLGNADIVSIMGHNNLTVLCINGGRLKVRILDAGTTSDNSYIVVKGITWIGCGLADSESRDNPQSTGAVLSILGSQDPNPINLTIQNCSFQYSQEQVIFLNGVIIDANIIDTKFENTGTIQNNDDNGNDIIFSNTVSLVLTLKNCHFYFNKGISIIRITNDYLNANSSYSSVYLINSIFRHNKCVSVKLKSSQGNRSITLHISREVLFENNVAENGAGISIIGSASTVIFGKNSNTTFVNNSIDYNGAAMYLDDHSRAIFDSNSIVTFANNKATNGIIYSKGNSRVIFKGVCQVTFSGNSATQYGSAIYSTDNSHLIFTGNAKVKFSNNNAISTYKGQGGTIFSKYSGYISFENHSIAMFNNNQADFGAAIYSIDNSSVVFKDMSTVLFNNHKVHNCGVLTSVSFSNITFADHTNVTFNTNAVSHSTRDSYESSAGAICTFQNCNVTFSDNSLVIFINNRADRGGAVLIDESNVIIEDYSTVIFYSNFAWYSSGGALVCSKNSNVVIKNNSNVTFDTNKARRSGGSIYSNSSCKISFKDNSTSIFINNTARDNGGALFSSQLCEITFEGNSHTTFANNTSDNGGALYFINFAITFKDLSKVSFHNNLARQSGGVGYCSNGMLMTEDTATIKFDGNMAENAGGLYIDMCNITFKDSSTSSFINNNARDNGGAILSQQFSNIIFVGNSTVTFNNNTADNGGALYLANSSDGIFSEFTNVSFHHNTASFGAAVSANDHCNITLMGNSSLLIAHNEAMQSGGGGYLNYSSNFIIQENTSITVIGNKALHGGGMCIKNKAKILFKGNSNVFFYKNVAIVGGGAIKVYNDSIITIRDCTAINFTENNAQYGGAIFLDTNAFMIDNSDNISVYFINNIAKLLGDSVYQEATWLCNSSCKINRTSGISNEFIATPPNELKFYHPAICIDKDNDMQCKQYYVQNVMLGKEIAIPACVLDYNNHTVDSAQFKVHNEKHPIYNNSGPSQVLISCDQYERVNITGNQSLLKSINFTINFTLNVALNPNWKKISVNLIVELSPCRPGFWHYPNSVKCGCYNDNDIVFCSDSSSMIKRGYWFGSVTGKPTVAFCPINYCNFTCCETSNGYYQLSPVRDNQCRSHRSGIACGSCEEGYTLSFDSIECLDLNECTTGQTILVLALILLYWIVIIVAVFSLMHFKVGIGYLYAITYYYSVVDLLLNQNWYLSSVLNTTINIISSTAKIIPQYLGKFCFIKNMSGIDQQFIHYMHPVAISLFLVMITIVARRSHRLASFISKGIIHVICYLLLLSYTSVATTSLLLMRPLIFHDVDKVYTYVSPDIEYLHGRHLGYAIVALLFTIIIVIGLPLLLGLEPFLNSKINFVKIKPLLDQFQGCYKDKYRCFAAYYMICRLVIITIIIANSSNDFVLQYLLITVCVITTLIHLILKPYSNPLLNNFDGGILLLLILSSALSPFVEFIDDSDTTVFMGITFVIVMLPLLIFITMSLMINKEKIKKSPSYCYHKCSQIHLRNYNQIPLEEVEELSDEEEYINVIDDSRRINATICDV